MVRIRETYDFASGAISDALGQDIFIELKGGTPGDVMVSAVFGEGFERVLAGDLRISSRRLEVTVTLSDLPDRLKPVVAGHQIIVPRTQEEKDEKIGERLEVVSVQSDVEGVSATLVLKRRDPH